MVAHRLLFALLQHCVSSIPSRIVQCLKIVQCPEEAGSRYLLFNIIIMHIPIAAVINIFAHCVILQFGIITRLNDRLRGAHERIRTRNHRLGAVTLYATIIN